MEARTAKYKVSIVTPAFNAARTLPEAMDSVLAQTLGDWEWLIIDDGSTDATADLVRAAAASDPRIRALAVKGETGLPARARNLGLASARGAYIAFLDADDLWAPEKLEKQVAYLEAHPAADGVCCWFDTFGDPERVRREHYRLHTAPVCSRREVVHGMPFFTLTLLIRRTCYEALGGMDEDPRLKSTEDAEYFARLVFDFQIHRLCEVLARYRLAPTSAPSLSQTMQTEGNEKGWKLTQVLEEKGLLTPHESRQRRAHLHYEQARITLHQGRGAFRGHLWRSVSSGAASWQATLTFLLCFLPGPVLSVLLNAAQMRLNTKRARQPGPCEKEVDHA